MNPIQQFVRIMRKYLSRRDGRKYRHVAVKLRAETLEARDVPSAAIRSIDGSGNNLAHTTWGQTGTDFIRLAPAQYADGISTPAGATRPSARTVSNTIDDQAGQSTTNDRLMSAMVYAWGQFIDHDIDLTQSGTGSFNVPVPTGDASFDPNSTGTQVIPMTRSAGDPATGTSKSNPRQQVNSITAWLDGSMIYGSDTATANSLRTMQDGKMKTSAGNLLPTDATGAFLAGDVRANENPELTSLQTLFVREHNRVADQIKAAHPSFTDEQIYQQARAWVIAEVQAITYNEWLPALLGTGGVGPYRGYNPNVNPSISNEFATAAFRFGHSIVGDDIEFLANDGTEIADSLSLRDAFFNPAVVKANGIDPILKYLASDPTQEVDTKVVDDLRNFLFGQPGQGGMDLAALNIQRGRDHGLADYNTTRAAYGLPRVTDFSQITSDPALQAKLKTTYGTVNNIDLWVGGLAENHVPGGSVGPLFKAIISEQFGRLRAADRFWYQNTVTGSDLDKLNHTTLESVIERNTKLTSIQDNAFFFRVGISGTAFADLNRDGKLNPGERVLPGIQVQLVDATSHAIVATTTTDRNGVYHFGVPDGLSLGKYQVVQVLATGFVSTTTSPVFAYTSGEQFVNNVNLGSAPTLPPAPAPTNPPPLHTATSAPPQPLLPPGVDDLSHPPTPRK